MKKTTAVVYGLLLTCIASIAFSDSKVEQCEQLTREALRYLNSSWPDPSTRTAARLAIETMEVTKCSETRGSVVSRYSPEQERLTRAILQNLRSPWQDEGTRSCIRDNLERLRSSSQMMSPSRDNSYGQCREIDHYWNNMKSRWGGDPETQKRDVELAARLYMARGCGNA